MLALYITLRSVLPRLISSFCCVGFRAGAFRLKSLPEPLKHLPFSGLLIMISVGFLGSREGLLSLKQNLRPRSFGLQLWCLQELKGLWALGLG